MNACQGFARDLRRRSAPSTARRPRTVTLPARERFNAQTARLVRLGLAGSETFTHLEKYADAAGNFILVPGQPHSPDWKKLIPLIKIVRGKEGESLFDRKSPEDVIGAPTMPTLLADVDYGGLRTNVEPFTALREIQREGRIPFHSWSGFVLAALFPQVLLEHYLLLVGSRLGDCVPVIYTVDNWPIFDAVSGEIARWFTGTPSCARVYQ